MNVNDVVVQEHEGAKIKLEKDTGLFYVMTSDGSRIADKTLKGIITKLNQRKRVSARAQALSLPAVVVDVDRGWRYEEGAPKWYDGVFKGVNAHTGEITLEVKGKPVTVPHDAWFLRPDDPALPSVRAAVQAEYDTETAHTNAEKARDSALEKNGFQLSLFGRRSRHRDKATAAAEAEEALVNFLAPPKEAK